jgi:hypothetical protein
MTLRGGPLLFVLTLLAVAVAGTPGLRAQLAPPPQDYVAAIGRSPLKAPLTPEFSPGAAFTVEAWVYLEAPSPGLAWIAGQGLAVRSADPFLGWALGINADQRAEFSCSTGAPGSFRKVSAGTAMTPRVWTHLAAVVDGTAARLYIDGTLAAAAETAGPVPAPGPVPLTVGVGLDGDGRPNYQPFTGYARQVRFWSVARTAAQLAAAAGQTLPTDRTGLVAAWPLDEAPEARVVRDLSGANRALAPLSGDLQAVRLGRLAAGPYFALTTTAFTDGSLRDVEDGQLIDFDHDGDPDLVLTQLRWPPTVPGTPTRLRAFRNDRGSFADVTDAVLGNVTMIHPRYSEAADFNRDGRADLLIVGHGTDTPPYPGEQSKLLIQSPDGRLVDETDRRLTRRLGFTHSAAVGDIDGDGDPDIYMGNVFGGEAGFGPRFFLNDGAGFFSESADRLPSDIAGRESGAKFLSVLLLDVDRSGALDLVLGHDGDGPGRNEILFNDGTGRFRRESRSLLPAKLIGAAASTVAIATADFNRDGWPDLLLSITGGSNPGGDGRANEGPPVPALQLLLNRGNGTFADASPTLGITWSRSVAWVKWPRLIDLNGDGHPDLVAHVNGTNGWDRRLWLNRGDAGFVEVTDVYRPEFGTAFFHAADLDRDGRTDLIGANALGITVGRNVKDMAFGRLANLSVRTPAGTGDATLIVGFALGGAAPAPVAKPMLVRAVGPSLGAFGVPGVLADPAIDVAPLGAARAAANDNWSGTPALKAAFAAVGAFPLADDASRDAALMFSPLPGAYTATVSGGGGVALVEVYDAGPGLTPRLTNLSARTVAGTGADALIAGFVVNGTLPKRLLLRAAGPTLAAFGVGNSLADPRLVLRPLNSDTIVAANDDWGGTAALKAAFASVGAFPFAADDARDAALVLELPPGAYTATVSGKDNTTGVALVEVYELP